MKRGVKRGFDLSDPAGLAGVLDEEFTNGETRVGIRDLKNADYCGTVFGEGDNRGERMPEQTLWANVLSRGIFDAMSGSLEAENWVFSDETETGSFLFCCDAVGVECVCQLREIVALTSDQRSEEWRGSIRRAMLKINRVLNCLRH
jgi:hypothetical protein